MKILIILVSILFTGSVYSAESLSSALEAAGENRAEIERALKEVPEGQRKGMQFLVQYMPAIDLETIKAEFLIENVALAYRARSEFPWASKVPEEIFFNDVLPYAVLNETRDSWRKDFYDRFSKHVKDAQTMEDAIRAVNAAIKSEVKVEYNTKRRKPHQSPYESMEIQMASCTGLSILLTDAFRSVGIPARVAGIPMWTTKKGNHNWVEVWTPSDKIWHCTEYYPDGSGKLDRGWYLKDASRCNPESFYHSIYASSWKTTGMHFPMVWDMDSKQVAGVNVSEFYIKLTSDDEAVAQNVCELRIDYTVDGRRISVPVEVTQADARLDTGVTPKPTDDMNRFYSYAVKKGQMYQVKWLAPGEKKWRSVDLEANETKTESGFLRLKLKN